MHVMGAIFLRHRPVRRCLRMAVIAERLRGDTLNRRGRMGLLLVRLHLVMRWLLSSLRLRRRWRLGRRRRRATAKQVVDVHLVGIHLLLPPSLALLKPTVSRRFPALLVPMSSTRGSVRTCRRARHRDWRWRDQDLVGDERAASINATVVRGCSDVTHLADSVPWLPVVRFPAGLECSGVDEKGRSSQIARRLRLHSWMGGSSCTHQTTNAGAVSSKRLDDKESLMKLRYTVSVLEVCRCGKEDIEELSAKAAAPRDFTATKPRVASSRRVIPVLSSKGRRTLKQPHRQSFDNDESGREGCGLIVS